MLRRLAHLRYRRELLRRKCSSEFFGSCLALPVTPNTKIPGPDPTKSLKPFREATVFMCTATAAVGAAWFVFFATSSVLRRSQQGREALVSK